MQMKDPEGSISAVAWQGRGVPAGAFAPTMQALLDDWADLAPVLDHRRQALDRTGWGGAHAFDPMQCMAPLPRAYQWADASVYRNYARLIYQWRKEPIPTRYEGGRWSTRARHLRGLEPTPFQCQTIMADTHCRIRFPEAGKASANIGRTQIPGSSVPV
jgi:hypothetical protein